MARNLPVPLGPIKEFVHRLFWAPDEVAGSTAARVKELKLVNPGMLDYLPDEFQTGVVIEARPEDEPAARASSFEAYDSGENRWHGGKGAAKTARAMILREARRELLCSVQGERVDGFSFEACSTLYLGYQDHGRA